MRFVYRDLGQLQRGVIVEAVLQGSEANVVLLDSSNFNAFKRGRRFRGAGGLAKSSPVHLTVPRSGRWYAVAYLPAGYRGKVRAGFRVLPGPLKPIPATSAPALGSVRESADQYAATHAEDDAPDRAFDVFICHASEDKEEVVRPIAHALRERGLRVWYDEFELRIGDNLRRKIDRGVSTCRFGVVVLSKAFFAKDWPNYELDGLVTRELSGEQQIVLPVWHGVRREDVKRYSASLATKLARATSEVTIQQIADEITGVVLHKSVT